MVAVQALVTAITLTLVIMAARLCIELDAESKTETPRSRLSGLLFLGRFDTCP